MVSRGTAGRLAAGILTLGLAGLAGGCQGGGAALEGPAAQPKEKITQGELLAFCPPIGLRQGTAFYTSYEKTAPARPVRRAAAGDAAAAPEDAEFTDKPAQRVVYQTSITDVTRACKRDNGILTMTVGVAGKVVPGAAAKPGTVQLPIRIAVTTGDQVLFSQLFRYSVQVGSLTTATQFLFTTSEVSFPDPASRGVRGYAGFDEGPPQASDAPGLPPS